MEGSSVELKWTAIESSAELLSGSQLQLGAIKMNAQQYIRDAIEVVANKGVIRKGISRSGHELSSDNAKNTLALHKRNNGKKNIKVAQDYILRVVAACGEGSVDLVPLSDEYVHSKTNDAQIYAEMVESIALRLCVQESKIDKKHALQDILTNVLVQFPRRTVDEAFTTKMISKLVSLVVDSGSPEVLDAMISTIYKSDTELSKRLLEQMIDITQNEDVASTKCKPHVRKAAINGLGKIVDQSFASDHKLDQNAQVALYRLLNIAQSDESEFAELALSHIRSFLSLQHTVKIDTEAIVERVHFVGQESAVGYIRRVLCSIIKSSDSSENVQLLAASLLCKIAHETGSQKSAQDVMNTILVNESQIKNPDVNHAFVDALLKANNASKISGSDESFREEILSILNDLARLDDTSVASYARSVVHQLGVNSQHQAGVGDILIMQESEVFKATEKTQTIVQSASTKSKKSKKKKQQDVSPIVHNFTQETVDRMLRDIQSDDSLNPQYYTNIATVINEDSRLAEQLTSALLNVVNPEKFKSLDSKFALVMDCQGVVSLLKERALSGKDGDQKQALQSLIGISNCTRDSFSSCAVEALTDISVHYAAKDIKPVEDILKGLNNSNAVLVITSRLLQEYTTADSLYKTIKWLESILKTTPDHDDMTHVLVSSAMNSAWEERDVLDERASQRTGIVLKYFLEQTQDVRAKIVSSNPISCRVVARRAVEAAEDSDEYLQCIVQMLDDKDPKVSEAARSIILRAFVEMEREDPQYNGETSALMNQIVQKGIRVESDGSPVYVGMRNVVHDLLKKERDGQVGRSIVLLKRMMMCDSYEEGTLSALIQEVHHIREKTNTASSERITLVDTVLDELMDLSAKDDGTQQDAFASDVARMEFRVALIDQLINDSVHSVSFLMNAGKSHNVKGRMLEYLGIESNDIPESLDTLDAESQRVLEIQSDSIAKELDMMRAARFVHAYRSDVKALMEKQLMPCVLDAIRGTQCGSSIHKLESKQNAVKASILSIIALRNKYADVLEKCKSILPNVRGHTTNALDEIDGYLDNESLRSIYFGIQKLSVETDRSSQLCLNGLSLNDTKSCKQHGTRFILNMSEAMKGRGSVSSYSARVLSALCNYYSDECEENVFEKRALDHDTTDNPGAPGTGVSKSKVHQYKVPLTLICVTVLAAALSVAIAGGLGKL